MEIERVFVSDNKFNFEISLSVLNHLGRNLYRSFITVLGEAISNSWDADANNVWIEIDKNNNSFIIKDDGVGMSEEDFQNKFLTIGYSKRQKGEKTTAKKRPYIGRKGIGKLALLSCAKKITVISKKGDMEYVGGCIDNSSLDEAITDNLKTGEYELESWSIDDFNGLHEGHKSGTIILFEEIDGGIKNTLAYIKRVIALYFRFSLIDKSFNIYVDGELVTHKDIGAIGSKTQFLWRINEYNDPFIEDCLEFLKHDENLSIDFDAKGFIASVEKPSDLKIRETDEKLTIDLFVNGRLREKDILKNIPTNRLVESYIYGQIHFDNLDDGDDPFTSSREGVKSDNKEYRNFLSNLQRKVLPKVFDKWDELRRLHGNDGDPENTKITRKQRKSEELFNAVSEDFNLEDDDPNKDTINKWARELKEDAQFCFSSYAECYISENLLRRYIKEKAIPLNKQSKLDIAKYKEREKTAKGKGNISIAIRKTEDDLSYLDMDGLASLFDKKDVSKENSLYRDSCEYKPMRNAVMHTAMLGTIAKTRLSLTYENIKGRLRELMSGKI